ncbi:hypothetical protein FDP41_004136 [Naegleria fowleri]|uniref:Uncharacterized protein n=1 Tax=Naegleria fowleri TaxID=5763 RepID=A0A6A5BRD6_NAEFO|nr:uncharacterized protein FDP41_004136 [Naegleria fowleri]KAF0976841.1 hypothetical protein FDP41_004136 [Naegleria fowleri]
MNLSFILFQNHSCLILEKLKRICSCDHSILLNTLFQSSSSNSIVVTTTTTSNTHSSPSPSPLTYYICFKHPLGVQVTLFKLPSFQHRMMNSHSNNNSNSNNNNDIHHNPNIINPTCHHDQWFISCPTVERQQWEYYPLYFNNNGSTNTNTPSSSSLNPYAPTTTTMTVESSTPKLPSTPHS